MAGIGFQLTKLMQKRTLAGGLHAYGFAALIGSGPWALSMVTLASLGLVLHRAGQTRELDLFFITVTHIFAFSLVATGPIQLVLSRYAADCVFAKQEDRVFPSLLGGLAIVLGLFTRPVAFILSGQMAVAYFIGHFQQSFWPSVNMGTPAILYCFIFLYFVFSGAGVWSIDAMIARAKRDRAA